MELDASDAAQLVNRLRQSLVEQRESFIFETVLSDPVGDKVDFLSRAAAQGYTVVMVFIGIDGSTRFPRTMRNLARAIRKLPHVLVFDNSDLARPFRQVA